MFWLNDAQWAAIEPAMKDLARGKSFELDAGAVKALCSAYAGHAQFEETVWLPLSARVLAPDHQAALGLTLHLRHALDKVVAHI